MIYIYMDIIYLSIIHPDNRYIDKIHTYYIYICEWELYGATE